MKEHGLKEWEKNETWTALEECALLKVYTPYTFMDINTRMYVREHGKVISCNGQYIHTFYKLRNSTLRTMSYHLPCVGSVVDVNIGIGTGE